MDNYQNHSISFLETEVDDVEWVKANQKSFKKKLEIDSKKKVRLEISFLTFQSVNSGMVRRASSLRAQFNSTTKSLGDV